MSLLAYTHKLTAPVPLSLMSSAGGTDIHAPGLSMRDGWAWPGGVVCDDYAIIMVCVWDNNSTYVLCLPVLCLPACPFTPSHVTDDYSHMTGYD